MSNILRVFFDIFTLWYDVVGAQDIAFLLLDKSVSSQAVSYDIFWIASLGVVFLSVPVFPVCFTRKISAGKVSLHEKISRMQP